MSVRDEWVAVAHHAYVSKRRSIYAPTVSDDSMCIASALAAAAPLLRRAALEEAAGVASSFDNGRFVYDGNGMLVPTRAGVKIAAAIRALDTKEAGV